MYFLLLTMALDLSRPEFQPSTDVSGNYIVSSVSDNESTVELLSELPPITYTAVAESDNTDIVDAINESISHNDAYWELFLDSYPVTVHHTLSSYYGSHWTWKFSASGGLNSADSSNDRYAYIPVQTGIEYTISNITVPSFNSYRVGVVNDILNPTLVTDFRNVSSPFESFSFRASQDGYLVLFINYSRQIGFVADWDTVEQESYTLSELGNAVTQSYDKLVAILMCLSGCELILLFSAVVPFLTKVIDKLMNKKED